MKKKVYICAPLGGNVEENLKNAVRYTEYALRSDVAPIVSHFYALCLDDNNPKDRALGMSAGKNLLWFCDEMWIFGNEITAGMREEIKFCKDLKIRMRKVNDGEIKKLIGEKSHGKEEKLENLIVCNAGTVSCGDIISNDNDGGIRFG